jgi:chlorobactene glucosyltransferase
MTAGPTLIALVFGALVALALRHIVRQFCYYRGLDLACGPIDAGPSASVAIIVPARNERHNIETCLRSLAGQIYARDRLRIIAVDDGSSDGTAACIRAFAAEGEGIELIEAPPLPRGWAGKPYACWLGALAADCSEWLCFIDADTLAAPRLIGSAVAAAQGRGIDMVSLEPLQELTGFLDRLVLPLGFLALAATQSLERMAVNGQFILIRGETYFNVGGHATHPDAICEDLALAQAVKQAGGRLAVLGGEDLIRARMYRDAASLWQGLSKNLTEIYGGPARTLAIAALALIVGWCAILLPAHAILNVMHDKSPLAIVEIAVAVPTALVMFSMQIALARHFRIPLWYGLLLPLSATVGAAIAANAVLCKLRRRVSWKGRVYSA